MSKKEETELYLRAFPPKLYRIKIHYRTVYKSSFLLMFPNGACYESLPKYLAPSEFTPCELLRRDKSEVRNLMRKAFSTTDGRNNVVPFNVDEHGIVVENLLQRVIEVDRDPRSPVRFNENHQQGEPHGTSTCV